MPRLLEASTNGSGNFQSSSVPRVGCLYNVSTHPEYELLRLSRNRSSVEVRPGVFAVEVTTGDGEEFIGYTTALVSAFINFNYDAQRLKEMAVTAPGGQTSSYAIIGALTLYLDFINLFLFLLRFTGNRRE